MTTEEAHLLDEIWAVKDALEEIQALNLLSAGQKLQLDAAIRCLGNTLRGVRFEKARLRDRKWDSFEFALFSSAAFFLGLVIGLNIQLI